MAEFKDNIVFENLSILDEDERAELKRKALESITDSDMIFSRDPATGALTTSRHGVCANVIVKGKVGVYRIDVDTGITLEEGRELDLFALCNYYSSYRFKLSGFSCAPSGEICGDGFSWNTGENIHFVLEVPIATFDINELVIIGVLSSHAFKTVASAVASGEKGLIEAVEEELFQQVGHGRR